MGSSRRGGLGATGSGRILCWRGGSIWIGRAGDPTDIHSHHAIQVTFSLSAGECHLQSPDGEWKAFRAALVPAHRPHALDARGEVVAVLFVEPESREGRAIRDRFCEGIAALPDQICRPGIAALSAAYDGKCSDQELIACARTVTAELAATLYQPTAPLDPRVERAITLLHEQLGQTINLADIAEAVHLSPERFRHLFIEQTGIRFRPYILWLRLGTALSLYASGASLTDAAYTGGFADSAHFSRTFKRMFGTAPIGITPE